MYSAAKLKFDPRIRILENAPEITTEYNGYGYVQGKLETENPFKHNRHDYTRLDKSTYYITANPIDYVQNTSHEKKWEKKSKFIHRTVQQQTRNFINGVDIGKYVTNISLKHINTDFTPIEIFTHKYSNSDDISITNSNLKKDRILLEKDECKVIGVENRYSGIKTGKMYTIFGEFDNIKQKMKKSNNNYDIIVKITRDEFIEKEKKFTKGWKLFWGFGMIIGGCIGCIGYLLNTIFTNTN